MVSRLTLSVKIEVKIRWSLFWTFIAIALIFNWLIKVVDCILSWVYGEHHQNNKKKLNWSRGEDVYAFIFVHHLLVNCFRICSIIETSWWVQILMELIVTDSWWRTLRALLPLVVSIDRNVDVNDVCGKGQ